MFKAAEVLRNVLNHPEPMDYRCEGREIIDELIYRRRWCHLIGIGTLCQQTPIIIPKKGTAQPGDAFEDADFEPRFEIAKI
jgi:hypothetical protein